MSDEFLQIKYLIVGVTQTSGQTFYPIIDRRVSGRPYRVVAVVYVTPSIPKYLRFDIVEWKLQKTKVTLR